MRSPRAARASRRCYTTSPVCIPARAGFACGKYIHQIGYWDNADAYDGAAPSWHHLLRESGHRVASVGKLHFRLAGRGPRLLRRNHPDAHLPGQGRPARADPRRHAAARQLEEDDRHGGAGRVHLHLLRQGHLLARAGLAARRGDRSGTTSPGCCSSPSSRRISRSPRRPSITTATGTASCRCRSSTRAKSGRSIPTSSTTAATSTTTTISNRRRT